MATWLIIHSLIFYIIFNFTITVDGFFSYTDRLKLCERSHLRSKKANIDFNQLVPQDMEWMGGLEDIKTLILFEDNNVLVMYKPPTILSQPDKENNDNLLDACKRYVETSNGDYIGLVHRIDRPCSGILVFSKTLQSTAILSEQFKKRSTDKHYLCVVNGYVTESRSCHDKILKTSSERTRVFPLNSTRNDAVDAKLRFKPLKVIVKPPQQASSNTTHSEMEAPSPSPITQSIDTSTSTSTETSSTAAGALIAAAITTLPTVAVAKEADYGGLHQPAAEGGQITAHQSLLQVELETGRKHQIRAQLAHIGLPVVGDVKYGAPQAFRNRDICLHAFSLTFNHPISKKQMRFRSDVPRIWGSRFGSEVLDETRKLMKKS